MGFRKIKVCDEIWGAKQCWNELVYEPREGEVFEIIKEKIESGELDHIPDYLEITATECLDEDCERWEEYTFEIDPSFYLTDDEYTELYNLIAEYYGEEKL